MLVSALNFHAGHQAFYTFTPEDGAVKLEIRVSQADLSNELDSAHDCDVDADQDYCASRYFQSRLKLEVNGNVVPLYFNDLVRVDDQLIITYKALVAMRYVQHVKLTNRAFFTSLHLYENIVRFAFDQDVSYEMSAQRTVIEHTFRE